MSIPVDQDTKTSWWGLKGETLVLLSCTNHFGTFIECRPEEVVNTLKITDLFLPTAHHTLSVLAQRTFVSATTEVADLQILTRSGIKKRVRCSLRALPHGSHPIPDPSFHRVFEITLLDWPQTFAPHIPQSPLFPKSMEIDSPRGSFDAHQFTKDNMGQRILPSRSLDPQEDHIAGVRARMSVRSLLN